MLLVPAFPLVRGRGHGARELKDSTLQDTDVTTARTSQKARLQGKHNTHSPWGLVKSLGTHQWDEQKVGDGRHPQTHNLSVQLVTLWNPFLSQETLILSLTLRSCVHSISRAYTRSADDPAPQTSDLLAGL